MPARGSAQIAPGQGPSVELIQLPGGGNLFVPTAALRALRTDTNELDDVKMNPDGGVLVRQTNPPDFSSLDAMEASARRMTQMQPARALQYARDAQDRMRVSVDSSVVVGAQLAGSTNMVGVVTMAQSNNGANSIWYTQGAPMSMDAREVYEQSTRMEFQQTRARWAVT